MLSSCVVIRELAYRCTSVHTKDEIFSVAFFGRGASLMSTDRADIVTFILPEIAKHVYIFHSSACSESQWTGVSTNTTDMSRSDPLTVPTGSIPSNILVCILQGGSKKSKYDHFSTYERLQCSIMSRVNYGALSNVSSHPKVNIYGHRKGLV